MYLLSTNMSQQAPGQTTVLGSSNGDSCTGVKQRFVKLSTHLSLEPRFICKIYLYVLTRLHGGMIKCEEKIKWS